MTETAKIAPYQMNPAEDMILYSDEIAEGMWVMYEDARGRSSGNASEDEQIRMNRFCRVTRMRSANNGMTVVFIGEWVDGFQKRYAVHKSGTWIVKRENPAELEVPETPETTGEPT